ncbi:MAG: acyl carrier protein [Saprospiraceae bacterium]|nr:acyl carrier protein [Saprospiraceae bacterium]
MEDIKKIIRKYILENLKPDYPIKDDTYLVSSRIIDEMQTLTMVGFLEDRFNIVLELHDVSQDNLNTINNIAALVYSKMNSN